MTLAELKAKATELGLTPDDVRAFGSLAKKATWETAIAEFKQPEAEDTTHQNAVAQTEQPTEDNTVQRHTDDELPFEPTHTLVDGEWVKVETTNSQPSGIRPFRPVLTEICKPDNSGYLVWDEKLQNWVKEKPSESSTPIRDKLFAKMMGYVDKAISLSDLEEMQKESPDEATAAIYLAILEESERLLKQAVAA